MEQHKEPAIRFSDLKSGDCIVSPSPRVVCHTEFEAGRMLEIIGDSSHLDANGDPLVKIHMGRAGDRVRRSEVIIDTSSLPKWQQFLPESFQIRLMMKRLFEGATSTFEEIHGRRP